MNNTIHINDILDYFMNRRDEVAAIHISFSGNDRAELHVIPTMEEEDEPYFDFFTEVTKIVMTPHDGSEPVVLFHIKDEEPEKKPMTQLEYMDKVLPKHFKSVSTDGLPICCPSFYGLKNNPECNGFNETRCTYCWNQPMEE